MSGKRQLALQRAPEPITLSTALCLPISSRRTTSSPSPLEKRGGVQAARAPKDRLRGAQLFRQLAKHFCIESRFESGVPYSPAAHLGNRLLTADAACRTTENLPFSAERREP